MTGVTGDQAGCGPELSGIGDLVERVTGERPGGCPAPVTHWHLVRSEIGTNDPERYSRERVEQLQRTGLAGATDDPRQALRWLTVQRAEAVHQSPDPAAVARRQRWHNREAWEAATRLTWWVLTCCPRTPAGGGIAVRDEWSVEVYAFPMTPMDCSRPH